MPLLYVLWTVALLTIIASTLLGSGTQSYRQARNAAEAAQHEALKDAAVNRAALALLDQRPERRWPVDGRRQSFTFAGAEVAVAIQDELGRVDLNQADLPLLMAALRAAGLPAQNASEIADKILDWREPGALKRLHGAKAAEYAAADLAHRPRAAAFQSVEELKLVLGITPQLFARLEPLVTVYSGRPMIDPQFAPPPLMAALSGQDANGIIGSPVPRGTGLLDPNVSLDGRAFSIRINLVPAGASQEAIVRLTANPARAHWLLSRRNIRVD